MKWILVSFLVLVSLPLSGDETRTFTPEETQRVAMNAYVCGRIDGMKGVFAQIGRDTKPLDEMYVQAGCADIQEMLSLKK